MMDTCIGEREKEGICQKCLGILFNSLNERDKAEKYLKKALSAAAEVSNKEEEADCSRRLGNLFQDTGKHGMAEEYVQRSLAISKASGNIREEIAHYATLGNVYFHIGEYAKLKSTSKQLLRKAKKMVTEKQKELLAESLARWCFGFAEITSRPKNVMKTRLKSAKNLALDEKKQ